MESQVLQSPYFLCFSASVLGIFLVWRNRFGAINSIKMQFEGSVILNNAKSSHRVNADRRHPWAFVILAIVSIPFILFSSLPTGDLCNLLLLFVRRIFEVFMVCPEAP